MMLRLDPPIPVDTPIGGAFAYFVIDSGPDHDMDFVCFLDATGECWMAHSRDVSLQPMGRPKAAEAATLRQIAESAIANAECNHLRHGDTIVCHGPFHHETKEYSVLIECRVTKKKL